MKHKLILPLILLLIMPILAWPDEMEPIPEEYQETPAINKQAEKMETPTINEQAEGPVETEKPASKMEKELLLLTGKDEEQTTTGQNNIVLNFKGVPLYDAITTLARQAKVNITLGKDVKADSYVTCVYKGNSVEDALRAVLKGMDLAYRTTPAGFVVTPWVEKYIDVNKVYQYGQYTGSKATSGQSGTMTQESQSQIGKTGQSDMVSMLDFGGYLESVMSMIKPLLSKDGIVSYMPTGFIYVKDRPSKVHAVEQMLVNDDRKREEVYIKIAIVRVDYDKQYKTGISWSHIFQGFKSGSPLQYSVSSDFLSNLSNSPDVLSLGVNNIAQNFDILMKALSKYGKVKVVHTWETRAMTGSVIPFDLTQTVWYSTGATVQVVGDQTITTPQIENTPVGLVITLNPVKMMGGEYLLDTSIRMSSIVGHQEIEGMEFPVIENNYVAVPISVVSGEQIAISGFKVRSLSKEKSGIPILSSLPILEYLFGYKSAQNRTSEIAVVISIANRNTI